MASAPTGFERFVTTLPRFSQEKKSVAATIEGQKEILQQYGLQALETDGSDAFKQLRATVLLFLSLILFASGVCPSSAILSK